MRGAIFTLIAGLTFVGPFTAAGQQQLPQPGQTQPLPNSGPEGQAPLPPDKRVFGVLPNYRTADGNVPYAPITAQQKLAIATKDSFDYPLFGLAAAYAGIYQLADTHPQFGQGVAGYSRRLGTSLGDQIIGNFLTEGVLPVAFREDPRYFRAGKLSGMTVKHRLWYAATRIFVTRTDAGGKSVNYAELLGNGTSAAIGLSYYEDSRSVGSYMQNLGTALATDAVSQMLKEIWPDVKQWHERRHSKRDTE